MYSILVIAPSADPFKEEQDDVLDLSSSMKSEPAPVMVESVATSVVDDDDDDDLSIFKELAKG